MNVSSKAILKIKLESGQDIFKTILVSITSKPHCFEKRTGVQIKFCLENKIKVNQSHLKKYNLDQFQVSLKVDRVMLKMKLKSK